MRIGFLVITDQKCVAHHYLQLWHVDLHIIVCTISESESSVIVLVLLSF